jgi:hypothetical protein
MQTMKDDFSTIWKTTNTISGRNGICKINVGLKEGEKKISKIESNLTPHP